MRWANYTDTADTGDDYLCSMSYAVDPDGVIYITDVVYSREPMEVTERLVADMLRDSGTRVAMVESNNGGRGFARAVQRLVPQVRVEWFHQSAQQGGAHPVECRDGDPHRAFPARMGPSAGRNSTPT